MKEINEFYRSLAKEISERKLFDISDIEVLLKTRFNILVSDILNNKKVLLEEKRLKLSNQVQKVVGKEKVKIQIELAEINNQIKIYNKQISEEEHKTNYELLKKFIRANIGDEILNQFFKTLK